jgi:hypothetical protein
MTWKDKLEIGLKDDAPYRRDNLPKFQTTPGGRRKRPGDPTRSVEEPGAREEAAHGKKAVAGRRSARRTPHAPKVRAVRARARAAAARRRARS